MKRLSFLYACIALFFAPAVPAAEPARHNKPARQYLELLENFAGWCEDHWNEKEEAFDAQGSGVDWPRGNGGVCLTYAVLLTEFPDKATFSRKQIRREVMLDHVKRAARSLCFASKSCTDARAKKPGTWGGSEGSNQGHWQSALATEHWVVAVHMLANQLDDDTRALVRQVATAEADLCIKTIPQAKRGNTAADDCCWNAGLLGVCSAIYADDKRAAVWEEWAKRWALNTEAREPDRASKRMVDGKPLGEWLVSTQVFPDLTLENHGFWDLPYQVCFAAISEPICVWQMCGKKPPESFYLNALEEGDNILKWLVLPDGDLLCPQGLDWAERDVQHQWAFTELGTLLDQPWARAAEARCLRTLTQRQAAFNDGSLHALDFGYQTDLANCWCYSFLLHKYNPRPESSTSFEEPQGAKLFPYVSTAVFRTPDLVSSVSWYGPRQAVMIVPNNMEALGDFPSLTAYRGDIREGRLSGLGFVRLKGDKKLRSFAVEGEPVITQEHETLAVSFVRTIKGAVRQHIAYCALPSGETAVFSRWEALRDIEIEDLADHPCYWVDIPGWLPKRTATKTGAGVWTIDSKLQMQVLGPDAGEAVESGIIGARRAGFTGKKGEILQDSVCVYQAIIPGRAPAPVSGSAARLQIGARTIVRDDTGRLSITNQQ